MDHNQNRFQERVGRINRSSAARLPSNVHIQSDGLIVQRRGRRFRPGIPWRSVVLAVFCCLMLKGFMIWNQGAVSYRDRLAVLDGGSMGQQIAARLLSMDPASVWISEQMTAFLGPPPQ